MTHWLGSLLPSWLIHITAKANPVKVNLIIPKPAAKPTGQSESCQSYPAKSAKAISYAKANPANALLVVWSQSSDPGCLPAHSTVLTQGMHCNAVVADTFHSWFILHLSSLERSFPFPQLIHICRLCMGSHTPHDSDSSSEVNLHLLTCIKDCLSMLEDLKQYWWFLGHIRLTVFSYWCHVHRGGRAPSVCHLQLLAIQWVWCRFWCKDFIIVELVESLVHNNLFQVIQFLLLLAMTDPLWLIPKVLAFRILGW